MPDLAGGEEAQHFTEGGVFGGDGFEVGEGAGGTDVPMGVTFFEL